MVNALQHDGAKRVAVVTPYQDSVNAQLAAFLASGESAWCDWTRSAHRMSQRSGITAEQVRDLARATMGPDCDALFIGCSQLPTYSILAGLEAEFAASGLVGRSAPRRGRPRERAAGIEAEDGISLHETAGPASMRPHCGRLSGRIRRTPWRRPVRVGAWRRSRRATFAPGHHREDLAEIL